MPAQFDLKGQVAVVTGGSRGIGRAIALAFAGAGASVAIVGRDSAALQTTLAELTDRGAPVATAVRADVSKVAEIEEMAAQVKQKLGPVDILVNSAGIAILEPSDMVSEESWDRVIDTNLKGTFFCASIIGRDMIARRSGRIINISSEEGIVGVPGHAAYCVTKAGIVHMTKVLALEWGQYNVRVNCIAPAAVRTQMNETYWLSDANAYAWVVNRIALGRVSEADEIAGAALYLASDESSFVTGHTLVVDGGISVGMPRRKEKAESA
jgi:NAD(P)-dependent dehydrogenase (short-subunit alcohol dehydrogenase family)